MVSLTSSAVGQSFCQEDIISIAVLTDWLRCQVNVGRSSKGISHYQGRAGKIICFGQRIHSSFEVAITT